jgi:hypothetical protein
MAGQNQITWGNKVNLKTIDVPRINKVTDADLNEIKAKFNTLDTVVTDPTNGIVKKVTDIENATSNINNTSDANKPISTATQLALDEKQDDLGITDETTHLLTPKEIREGAGIETKLITSQEADTKIATEVRFANPAQISLNQAGQAEIKKLHIVTSGNIVRFDTFRMYGFPESPLTGAIKNNITGGGREAEAIIYHKSGTEPNYPPNWKKTSGTYSTTELNKIIATFDGDLLVSYKIENIPFDIYNGMLFWLKMNELIQEEEGVIRVKDYAPNSLGDWDVLSSGVGYPTVRGLSSTQAVEGDVHLGFADYDNVAAEGGSFMFKSFSTPISLGQNFTYIHWHQNLATNASLDASTQGVEVPVFLIGRQAGGSTTAYALRVGSFSRRPECELNGGSTEFRLRLANGVYDVNDGGMKPYIWTYDANTLRLYGSSASTPLGSKVINSGTAVTINEIEAFQINKQSFSPTLARQGGQYGGDSVLYSRVITEAERAFWLNRKQLFEPLI